MRWVRRWFAGTFEEAIRKRREALGICDVAEPATRDARGSVPGPHDRAGEGTVGVGVTALVYDRDDRLFKATGLGHAPQRNLHGLERETHVHWVVQLQRLQRGPIHAVCRLGDLLYGVGQPTFPADCLDRAREFLHRHGLPFQTGCQAHSGYHRAPFAASVVVGHERAGPGGLDQVRPGSHVA
ncbi:MAG TPA: hypothetical protein VFD47_06945 [Actinomycetota bacterium]|nr:hypothetical protein [Actinomycetota bacterium]